MKGFSLIKRRNQERRKIKLNRRILWLNEEGSRMFSRCEYSSRRRSLSMEETLVAWKGCPPNPSLASLHLFRAGKSLHPTIQIFKLECYQEDSSCNLHSLFKLSNRSEKQAAANPPVTITSNCIGCWDAFFLSGSSR